MDVAEDPHPWLLQYVTATPDYGVFSDTGFPIAFNAAVDHPIGPSSWKIRLNSCSGARNCRSCLSLNNCVWYYYASEARASCVPGGASGLYDHFRLAGDTGSGQIMVSHGSCSEYCNSTTPLLLSLSPQLVGVTSRQQSLPGQLSTFSSFGAVVQVSPATPDIQVITVQAMTAIDPGVQLRASLVSSSLSSSQCGGQAAIHLDCDLFHPLYSDTRQIEAQSPASFVISNQETRVLVIYEQSLNGLSLPVREGVSVNIQLSNMSSEDEGCHFTAILPPYPTRIFFGTGLPSMRHYYFFGDGRSLALTVTSATGFPHPDVAGRQSRINIILSESHDTHVLRGDDSITCEESLYALKEMTVEKIRDADILFNGDNSKLLLSSSSWRDENHNLRGAHFLRDVQSVQGIDWFPASGHNRHNSFGYAYKYPESMLQVFSPVGEISATPVSIELIFIATAVPHQGTAHVLLDFGQYSQGLSVVLDDIGEIVCTVREANASAVSLRSAAAISLNVVHHLMFTVNDTESVLYLDSVEQESGSGVSNWVAPSSQEVDTDEDGKIDNCLTCPLNVEESENGLAVVYEFTDTAVATPIAIPAGATVRVVMYDLGHCA